MKHNLIYISLFTFILIFITGCSVTSTHPDKMPGSRQDQAPVTDKDLDSPYYYYMLSRLHNKKNELPEATASLKKAIDKDPESVFLKKEMINLYLAQNNFDAAIKLAENILATNPDTIDILFTLASLKIKRNKKKEAIAIYNKILTLKPDNKNTYLLLGKIFNDDKNSNELFKLYSKMLEHFPDSYIAHYYLGMAYLDQNKLNYAEEEFLKTIELSPKLVEPRLQLIDIYKTRTEKQTKPNKKILETYKEILKIEKQNDFVRMEYAIYLHSHGDKKKAEKIFFTFGEKSAKDEKFLLQIANEYIVKKKFKEAIVLFVEMLKAAPENASLNFFTGYAFDSLKEYKTAVKYYQKVKPGTAYYKKSIIHTAYLYKDNKDNERGIKLLEQFHKANPNDIDVITFLASFYLDSEDFKKCADILNFGLTKSKDNTVLLFKLGICMDKSNNKEECIKVMKKVIELEPENAEALNYLGYTYAELGIKLDEADRLITGALKLKPNDGFITDSLGWVYYKKGSYAKASKLLLKAAELTSFDPIIMEHLGDSYTMEKRLTEALSIYKRALKKITEKNNYLKIQLKKKIKELESKINATE
jgi:tetratricopeptide (TPR) repeat protein